MDSVIMLWLLLLSERWGSVVLGFICVTYSGSPDVILYEIRESRL